MNSDGEEFLKRQLVKLCEMQAKLLGKFHTKLVFVNSGGDRIVRLPELLERLGVSESTIWRWEIAGRFPRRRHIGECAVGWLESEINQWLKK
jgi:prophage regulatory protein